MGVMSALGIQGQDRREGAMNGMTVWAMWGVLVLSGLATSTAMAARTLETKFGDVELPDSQPQRVVTLYEGALDAAIAMGIKPLGAVASRGTEGVAAYIQPQAEGVQIVGTSRETNLEAVIALQPDLILASSSLPETQYQLLSSVAPTIVPDGPSYQADTWQRETRLFAQALNRETQGEQAIDAVVEQAAQVHAKLMQTVPEEQRDAYLMRWMPQGPLLMAPTIFSSQILAEAGFDVRDGGLVKADRPHSAPLSLENLSKADGHWMFLATLNDEGEQALEAAKQSPAFERLNVVQQAHVFPVNGQLWTSASGPIAAQAILQRLEQILDASSRR